MISHFMNRTEHRYQNTVQFGHNMRKKIKIKYVIIKDSLSGLNKAGINISIGLYTRQNSFNLYIYCTLHITEIVILQ